MTSLAEVYEGHVGEVKSIRRLYLGTGLFAAGALSVVLGIIAATTSVPATFGMNTWQSWELAGLLAGLGVPAVFVGVFTVLPASNRERAAAAIGAGVAILGVMLFWQVFPHQWHGDAQDFTLPVVTVYFFGLVTTFWALFTAVVNFKTRNDPGGTVTLQYETGGEVRTVEVAQSELEKGKSAGGVGFLGDLVSETETESQPSNRPGDARPASDGGAAETIRSPLDDAEVVSTDRPAEPEPATDRYCGNCAHFSYVRTDRGIQPYCGFDDRMMDDMDACEAWRPNNDR